MKIHNPRTFTDLRDRIVQRLEELEPSDFSSVPVMLGEHRVGLDDDSDQPYVYIRFGVSDPDNPYEERVGI